MNCDVQIFVVDVTDGDKMPCKGGPGVATADLLVINKVDLAERVGADMAVMVSDAHRMRGELPVITQSLTDTPNAGARTERGTTGLVADEYAPRPRGRPLLRQRLNVGGARLRASAGFLSGARVVATETVLWHTDPPECAGGNWWTLAPLASGGATATALADNTTTVRQRLSEAIGHHPDSTELLGTDPR